MATARRAVEVQNPAQPALPLKKIAKQPTTIEEWVKAKGLYPSYFQVTPEGDLISPPTRDSEQQKIIVIPRMTPKSAEQTQDFFKERREALKEPAEQYAAAKRALQQMMIVYKASPGTVSDNDILIANQQVHDAECILNGLRSMPRSLIVLNEEGDSDTIYTLKDLTLKRHETDRIHDPILQLQTTEYPLEAFWIEAPIPQLEQAQPAPAAADLEAQEADEEAAPKRPSKPLSAAAIASIKKARAARAAAAGI